MLRELVAQWRHGVVLVAALAMAGCAVTREPERKPELPLPDALPAVPEAGAVLGDPWWSIFNDPSLDALVREALANNADAAVAAARVAPTRARPAFAGTGRSGTAGAADPRAPYLYRRAARDGAAARSAPSRGDCRPGDPT